MPQVAQPAEVKQLIPMDRETMLEKLDEARKAIASVSWSFPSEHPVCVQLVGLEQGIFNVQDGIGEAS